ncbi:MAG: tRNA pseudouridine(55) synthase TruB, partial [Butyrivibrio sp.]|nr:tRNA pseudouridine(55) synthase TruB [Butyrivibrio sp.]
LRGILRMRRIGHTGTLDPEATGVLVVCVGNATKAVSLLTEHDKEYIALCQLGVTTDTQDLTGSVLEDRRPVQVTRAQLAEALQRFTGDYDQLPPMYSAISVGGRRLYELAREGKEVERKPRPVHIERITLLDDSLLAEQGLFTMEVRCAKGTYIRTLCHDIGAYLGCGGAMAQLTRTSVGAFRLEESRTLAEIEAARDAGTLEQLIVPTQEIFRDLDILTVREEAVRSLVNGNPFLPIDVVDYTPAAIDGLSDEEMPEPEEGQRVRVQDEAGRFYGIYAYSARQKQYRVERFFYQQQ